MRKMKDSGIEWIGEIPDGWDTIKLSYLFKTIGSGTTPNTGNSMFYDGEYHWLQTGDLTDGYVTTTSKTITQEAVDTCSALTLFKKGAVVIAMYGATIGKLGILDVDCYTNQACCALSEPIDTNGKFIYYWLLCNKENIVRLSLGGGQPNISQGIITGLKVSIPKSIDEQSRIADYLDKKCAEIDAIIAAKEKTNELLKERRQSIIYEAVTKGLDPTVPMKDSGIEWIGEIPESWDTIRVKHLATEKSSLFLDGDWINSDVITDEGIRYLTSGNVGEGFYKEQGKGYISEETFKKLNCLAAYPGDLMISRLNEPVGRCCIIPDGEDYYVVAVDNVILRPNQNFCKKYLLYCMNTNGYANAALMAASGTTMQRISRTALGNLIIPVASYAEQAAIAEYLDERCAEIDAIILSNNTSIEKLKEYRQSVIYEAVTGKTEL